MLGDDSGSVSGESLASEEGWGSIAGDDRQTKKKSSSPRSSRKKSDSKKRGKGLTQKEREMKQKMYEYRSGLANMPAYEVIQNSVHVQTGNIDLQFCDDSPGKNLLIIFINFLNGKQHFCSLWFGMLLACNKNLFVFCRRG